MSNKKRGLFITIEGCDGAGKTTFLAMLRSYLEQEGVEVSSTREPGGTPYSEAIRDLIKVPAEEYDDVRSPITNLLLVNAARRQHIDNFIIPTLEKGAAVLCDRFFDSTLAYQGAEGVSQELMEELHRRCQNNIFPDVTIVLDASFDVARERMSSRAADYFDGKGKEFHDKVRNIFISRAINPPANVDTDYRLIQTDGLTMGGLDLLAKEYAEIFSKM